MARSVDRLRWDFVLIASVYIGFAVADDRPKVIVAESTVASVFVVIAAVAVTGSVWLIIVGLVGHDLKDLWQHRRQFVANTRWWPPFCVVVDWVAAAFIAVAIIAGVDLQSFRRCDSTHRVTGVHYAGPSRSREAGAIMWKRCGKRQTAAERSSYVRNIARGAN